MIQQYKHMNSSFLVSTNEIKDKSLCVKINYALNEAFKGFIKTKDENPALSFIFTDHLYSFITEKDFYKVKDIRLSEKQIHFKDVELDFLINTNEKYKVYINVSDQETIKSSVRFFSKAFKNKVEGQIITFYYRIFLLFTQLWNVEHDASYLHASAVNTDGGAVLFSADSGVGKSALLFRLSQEKSCKFIADDLTIITTSSKAYYQGRSLSVKPYHLDYFPFLIEKLKKLMGKIQQFQWKIISDSRLIYRLSPNKLFEKSSEQAKIKRVVHLCSHTKDAFEIKNISKDDLVNSALPILINELFLANNRLNTLASLPKSFFPSSHVLYSKSRTIFENAVNNVDIKLVLVPNNSDPNLLYEFLKQEGCLN